MVLVIAIPYDKISQKTKNDTDIWAKVQGKADSQEHPHPATLFSLSVCELLGCVQEKGSQVKHQCGIQHWSLWSSSCGWSKRQVREQRGQNQCCHIAFSK